MIQQMTIAQAVELGLEHHRSGRLQEAETIYRQVLAAQPQHGDALYLLGSLAAQTGHADEAIDLLGRAIAANPSAAHYHSNLGQVLASIGRLDEAEQMLRRAIALPPQTAEAHANLGVVLRRKGDNLAAVAEFRLALRLGPDLGQVWNGLGDALQAAGLDQRAIEAFQQAATLLPDSPDAFYNLGNAMTRKRQCDQAVEYYNKALSLRPDYVNAINNLGTALKGQGKPDEAAAAFERAIQINPDFAEGWNNLSDVLYEMGRIEPALTAARKALALRPDYPDALNNAGNALRAAGQVNQAAEAYRKALAARMDFPAAENGLATVLVDLGQVDEGIAGYERAIALQPDFAPAHYNLGLTLLLKGDFERGWREHEWRSRLPGRQFAEFAKPQWDGSDLAGRRILLHAEQGFGDVIQFVRYAPLVRARQAGAIILLCQPQIVRLLKSLDESVTVVTGGDALPEFDVRCPLMSLPFIFKTTVDSIPATVPYLHAGQSLTAEWREKVQRVELAGHSKIGLAWAGHPEYANDRNRSISSELLAPLADLAGMQWFSLQKSKTMNIPGLELIDWTGELNDFSATAALIENLDLIISVDTAIAHLAGAMGKTVWTLLPFVPDWRWMMDRQDSPWYRTMKLFRQPEMGNWETPILRIVEALHAF